MYKTIKKYEILPISQTQHMASSYSRSGMIKVGFLHVKYVACFHRILTEVTIVRPPNIGFCTVLHARLRTFYNVGTAYIVDLDMVSMRFNDIKIWNHQDQEREHAKYVFAKTSFDSFKNEVRLHALTYTFENNVHVDILSEIMNQMRANWFQETTSVFTNPFKVQYTPGKFCVMGWVIQWLWVGNLADREQGRSGCRRVD